MIYIRGNYDMTFHDVTFSVQTIIYRLACVITMKASEKGDIILIL